MHQAQIVHVSESKHQLLKDMPGLLLREPSRRTLGLAFSLEAVLEQVASGGKFGHQEDVALVVKLLDQVDNVGAIPAELKSLGLGNSVFALQPLVLLLVDRFDHYEGAGEFVLRDRNRIGAALVDGPLDAVLV